MTKNDSDFVKQLESIRIGKIVAFSLLLFFVSFLIALISAIAINGIKGLTVNCSLQGILIFIFSYLALIVVHEAVHIACFVIFGKAKREDIAFGANLRQGLVYCHIKIPLARSVYMTSLLAPTLIIGLMPLIAVVAIGHINYMFLFSVMVSAGAGDILMFIRLAQLPKNALVTDHPTAPAFYLLYKKGSEPQDFRPVTIREKQQLLQEYSRKKKRK